ncbi:hypothetical protein K2173_016628 [Erythroxylum novogranatense]|uniref:C2H2-type domain-containing protein n=1 Tax=Erythroxylum novogranatense TaxID=1862640 RepID=A0AAV8SGZ5_9ROSI|nr:hypothetical protein K2173_016628 [Erythroxylum novogranatense]
MIVEIFSLFVFFSSIFLDLQMEAVGVPEFPCTVCQKDRTFSKKGLKDHCVAAHQDKKFKVFCEVCGMGCTNQNNLQQHTSEVHHSRYVASDSSEEENGGNS